MHNYANGGLTPGRWYKDNQGVEYRYIGEASSKPEVGLFTDGSKYVDKHYDEFEPNVKETKLFKWFKDGGSIDNATWHNVSFKEWNEMLQHHFPEEYKSFKLNDWLRWKELDRLYFVGKTPKQAIDYFKNWKKVRDRISGKLKDGGDVFLDQYWGSHLGDGFFIGNDVYITDPKSLFQHKTGFISGLAGKDLMITIVDNGVERNVLVSKKGVEKLDAPEYKDGGHVSIGDVIRLKHDLPLASLSNLKGKDLKVNNISNVYLGSGLKKFYHVTHDGDKYEIDEDFIDHKFKMADGGMMADGGVIESIIEIDLSKYLKGKISQEDKKNAVNTLNEFFEENNIHPKVGISYPNIIKIYPENSDQLDLIKAMIEDMGYQDFLISSPIEYFLEWKDSENDEFNGSYKTYEEALAEIKFIKENGMRITDRAKYYVDANGNGTRLGSFKEGGYLADGGETEFVNKTDEELKNMSDDELFAYLDAKAAYMKQYTRPLSAYKAKNFAANAAAVQYQKEGTSKLEENFPSIQNINKQAEKDYQEGIKKIVEKRKTPEELAKAKSNLKQLRYGGKLKTGGEVKFKDKVKAIEKKLLEKKKVPKFVQKDYGKTYDKAEAHESASRIVGSMLKKKWKKVD